MRKFLCFIGWHYPEIVRTVFWGNVHHAELKCVCGKRYECFVAGEHGYLFSAKFRSDFWLSYDTRTLPHK